MRFWYEVLYRAVCMFFGLVAATLHGICMFTVPKLFSGTAGTFSNFSFLFWLTTGLVGIVGLWVYVALLRLPIERWIHLFVQGLGLGVGVYYLMFAAPHFLFAREGLWFAVLWPTLLVVELLVFQMLIVQELRELQPIYSYKP